MISFLPITKVKAYVDTGSMVNLKDYSTNTKEAEYKITDADGLNTLSKLVNEGTAFEGVAIYLANNITFNRATENNFTSIGVFNPVSSSENKVFSGTFDGNNFSIAGININKRTTDYQCILFNNLSSAVIKNLKLSNSIINGRYQISGIVVNALNSTIDNCTIDSNTIISAVNPVSGIIYECNNTTVSNCVNSGSLRGNNYVAGIAFSLLNSSSVINCINTSNITSNTAAGGICIYNYDGCSIRSSYNTGNIIAREEQGGGIASINFGEITKCYNNGSISGADYIAGISGIDSSGNINNCYNTGPINATSTCGGIVGYDYDGICKNNYNVGAVSNSQVSGGIIGDNYSSGQNVINCYYLDSSSSTGIGNNTSSQAEAYSRSASNMKTNEFAYILNSNNFRESNSKIWTRNDSDNSGYSIYANSDNAVCKLEIINKDVNGTVSYAGVSTLGSSTGASAEATYENAYIIANSNVILNVNPNTGYTLTNLTINNVTTENTTGTFVMPNNDSTVSPVFSLLSSYSIAVNTNGGTLASGVSIPTEYTVESPDIILPTGSQITRPGYKFAGWYLTSDFGGDSITEIPTGTTGNLTLYANWSPLESFSITLETNGGTLDSSVTIPSTYTIESETIVLPTSSQIRRADYTFAGWYTNPEFGGNAITEIPKGSTGNINLYARWNPLISYSITVNTNGGVVNPNFIIPSEYVENSLPIPLPGKTEISRPGYIFEGWYITPIADESKEASTEEVILVTEIPVGTTGNIEVNAKWIGPVEYTIKLETNGGTLNPSVSIPSTYTVESETIILPTASQINREGYTFAGWYTNSEFGGNVITEIPKGSTGDITLYAKWNNRESPSPNDNKDENKDKGVNVISENEDNLVNMNFDKGKGIFTGDNLFKISIIFLLIVASGSLIIVSRKKNKAKK